MCSFLWKGHKNSLIETLQSLLKSDTLLDCTIAAGGQYLKAHKVILAASSPYFKLLFSQEQEKNPIVVLKDVNFQELKSIIEYIYKGEVEVPAGQVKSFLQTADSLQIVGLLGSTQEKVDGEDNGCLSATGNSPIAHKRRKRIHQEVNSRENTPDQAHFSVTDESSQISPFGVSSVHSNNCFAPTFLFKEKCVQDSSGIHDRVQNFGAPSSETRVENIVETNLANDNHPIVPFINKELITDNHEDLGLSNLCDSSMTHDVCDNITVNRRMEGQKESVENSFSMQQEPFLIIKQDPDSVEISEEHFEDGIGYDGGDFLEGNSTVGPEGDVVDAPHVADEVDRCGFIVVQHVESLFCEDEAQPLELEHFFEESDVGNISASLQRTLPSTLRSEDDTVTPLKRPRGRPPKKRAQGITHAPRGCPPKTCDGNEVRSFDLEPFSEFCCHLTSCETPSGPLSMTQHAPPSTTLSEFKTIAPLKRPRGRPPKTLSNLKMSPLKRPRGRPPKTLNENTPLALKRLHARSQKVFSKYLNFSQRRLRVRPSKTLSQDKTHSKNSRAPSIKTGCKDNKTLGGLPIKSESNIVNPFNTSRGRPRKRVGDYLKRVRDRPSEALSKYMTFPSLKHSHNHPSKTLIGEDITLKSHRGRPPKTPPTEDKTFNKRPCGRPCKMLTEDKIKPLKGPRSKTLGEVTTPLKRPRGRPRKTLSECSATIIKRPRGRPPKRLNECNIPLSSHSSLKMLSSSLKCPLDPGNLMSENIPTLGDSYVPQLKNEHNTLLECSCSPLIQTLLEENTVCGECLHVTPSKTLNEDLTLCDPPAEPLSGGDNISSLEGLHSLRSKTLSEESITRDSPSQPMSGEICREHQCNPPSITLSEYLTPCDSSSKLLSGNKVSPLECPRSPSSKASNEESISRCGSPCQPPLD